MRRNDVDVDSTTPVRNYVFNPAMRSSASAQVQATNFVTNPRPEPVNGLVAVRQNLVLNPRMTAANFGGYGSGTQTLTALSTGVTGHPYDINTAVRTAYVAGAVNPGVVVMQVPETNFKYTFSAWVYNEGSVSEYIALALKGYASGGQQYVAPRVWTKLSWTMTTPAALVAGNDFGVRISSPSADGSFLTTGVLIEKAGIVNDYFDGGFACRTNLANDGRATVYAGTNTIGWRNTRWFGGGNPAGTYSLVANATDGPLPNISTYMRKTWSSSTPPASNGDTGFDHMNGLMTVSPGQVYSITSWLRPSSAGKNVQHSIYWYDAQGAFTRGTYGVQSNVPAGQWVNVRSTITVPDGCVKIAICTDVQGGPVWQQNETLDGTALVLERADTPYVGYYDGTGDFTYVWSGTTNASSSQQRGQLATGYLAGGMNRAAAISSTEWSSSGTKSVRIIPLSAWDGTTVASYAEFTVTGLNIGSTYYLSAKSYLKAPLAAGYDAAWSRRFTFPGTAPSNIQHLTTPTNTPGVYEHKNSFTATQTSHQFRATNGAVEGGGEMWFADFMVSDQQGNYFDGGTAADSDYFTFWSGVAHASITRKSSNPPAYTLKTSTSTTNLSTHTENGIKFARWAVPAYTLAANWRVGLINGLNWQSIKAGNIYTIHTLYRYSGGWSTSGFNVLLQDGGATNAVPGTWLADTTTDLGSGWKLNKKTFKAGRDALASSNLYYVLPTVATGSADCAFDISYAAIYDGRYTGDYLDGASPLARWDGASDASSSVAYPTSILDIAGPASFDAETSVASNFALAGDFAGNEPRTIYTVYNSLVELTDTSIWALAVYGSAALNDTVPNSFITLRQQSYSGAWNNILARMTGGGGSIAINKQGINVAAYGLNANSTLFMSSNGGNITLDRSVTELKHEKLQITAPSTYGVHVRTLIFRGYHDTATQAAMYKLLSTKYGVVA